MAGIPSKRVKPEYQKRANAKRRGTPSGKINGRISAAVWQCLKQHKRGRKWEMLVGYNLDELMTHLERQFRRGMTWNNMGKWEIDHILPLSGFSFANSEDPEFKAAWALTNLRPEWALDNLKKHARRIHLI